MRQQELYGCAYFTFCAFFQKRFVVSTQGGGVEFLNSPGHSPACFFLFFKLCQQSVFRQKACAHPVADAVEDDMTQKNNEDPVRKEGGRIDASALDVRSESEGGFPCGEFLFDDEEEAAVEKLAAPGGETKTSV